MAKRPITVQFGWPRFNFKTAKVVKKFTRQGQECSVYANGKSEYTKCQWTGSFSGARSVNTYMKGTQRCTDWQLGLAKKTVCWEWKRLVTKNFV
jgi:hypothetical protein